MSWKNLNISSSSYSTSILDISPIFLGYEWLVVISNFAISSLLFNNVAIRVRLIIYTGKGGTGKTVTSCSTAVKLSRNHKKTIVISADPAHTLSDAFMIPDIGTEPKEIQSNLYASQ